MCVLWYSVAVLNCSHWQAHWYGIILYYCYITMRQLMLVTGIEYIIFIWGQMEGYISFSSRRDENPFFWGDSTSLCLSVVESLSGKDSEVDDCLCFIQVCMFALWLDQWAYLLQSPSGVCCIVFEWKLYPRYPSVGGFKETFPKLRL